MRRGGDLGQARPRVLLLSIWNDATRAAPHSLSSEHYFIDRSCADSAPATSRSAGRHRCQVVLSFRIPKPPLSADFKQPAATPSAGMSWAHRFEARSAAWPLEEIDKMLFMLTNRTRTNLSAAEYGELAALAKAFYASIPADVKMRGEWAAVDRSRNYSLVEAPDIETVRRIQAPFERFTETVIVPVAAISGWTAS
jgi:Domain of unknown function (DUF3303)